MNIIAVVVTYNRMELLKRNIRCLQQNKPISSIVIVNNGSTDGTTEWLAAQEGLTVINQTNVGGAGGFYTGIQLLPYTGKKDIGILAPRRLLEGEIFTHDFQAYNLSNPFVSMYSKKLAGRHITSPTEIMGTAFEGPFIRREVVEKIGLPNKDLFIFCDDTDYCLRTIRAGYKILYIPDALMDKEKFFSNDTWNERSKKKKWKRFYQIRNSTYLNHHYGRNIAVKYLRGFNGVMGYIFIALFTSPFAKAYQWKDIPRLWKAYCDGIHEKLGIMS